MEIITFAILFGVFLTFLWINLKGSKLFGVFAALVLLLIGTLLMWQDFLIPTGTQTVAWADANYSVWSNITQQYWNATQFYSGTYNPFDFLGLIFIGISIWMILSSALGIAMNCD